MTEQSSKLSFKTLLTVFALGTVSSSMYLMPYVKYVFYDALRAGLNASNEQVGFLLTIYAVACTIGYIPGGWIADRFSIKKIIMVSAITTGCLNLILAFVMDFNLAMVIWGLLGVSTAFAYWSASIKAIRLLGNENQQGRLYGFFQSFEGMMNIFSAFVAMGLFTMFASQVLGLKYTLIFYGIMCFVSAIMLGILYKDPVNASSTEEEKVKLSDIGKVLKLPHTWLMSFTVFTVYAVYSGSTYLTPYVTDVIGISLGMATVLAIFRTYVARFVFCPVGGYVADKTGQHSKTIRAIALVVILIFFGFFFVSASTNKLLVLIMIMASAAALYMNYGIFWSVSEEMKIPRHLYGTAIGIASIIGYFPDAFMHTMFGVWLDKYGNHGYNYIFAFLIAMAVLTVIITSTIIILKKKRVVGVEMER